ALCQDLKMPVCFHGGSSSPSTVQIAPYADYAPELQEAYRAITRPASNSVVMGNLLMSRILTRHPKLKVVFAESGLGWLIFTLETQDHEFERFNIHEQGYELKPSELFRRQCYVTGWYD